MSCGRAWTAHAGDACKYVAGDSEQAGRLHALAGQLAYHLNDYDDGGGRVRTSHRRRRAARGRGDGGDEPLLLRRRAAGHRRDRPRRRAGPAGRRGRGPTRPLPARRPRRSACSRSRTRVAGDFDAEREMHLARLAVAREHGDVARTADALGSLAEIALDEADADHRARRTPRRRWPSPTPRCRWRRARRPSPWRALPSPTATWPARRRLSSRRSRRRRRSARSSRSPSATASRARWPPRGAARLEAVRLYAAAQRLAPSPSGTDEPVEADLAGGLETARSHAGGRRVRARVDAGDGAAERAGARACCTTSRRQSRSEPGRQDGASAYASLGSYADLGGRDAESASVDACERHWAPSSRRGSSWWRRRRRGSAALPAGCTNTFDGGAGNDVWENPGQLDQRDARRFRRSRASRRRDDRVAERRPNSVQALHVDDFADVFVDAGEALFVNGPTTSWWSPPASVRLRRSPGRNGPDRHARVPRADGSSVLTSIDAAERDGVRRCARRRGRGQ